MTRPVTATNKNQHYKTTVTNGKNHLIADEKEEDGGKDSGFTPHELLGSALASCTAITVRMYADRKGWDLKEVIVDVSTNHEIINGASRTDFVIAVHLKGDLDGEQRARLLDIAKKCPVHKTLLGSITMTNELK
jgi:putative redox protein